MHIKVYESLPADAAMIRSEVFIREQGFLNEFDDIDKRAVHLVAFDGVRAAATCRLYRDEHERETYVIGRIAVIKEYRGKGIGSLILREAERKIRVLGGIRAVLLAQKSAEEFYIKQGYGAFGEICYDEFCPHIRMEKSL